MHLMPADCSALQLCRQGKKQQKMHCNFAACSETCIATLQAGRNSSENCSASLQAGKIAAQNALQLCRERQQQHKVQCNLTSRENSSTKCVATLQAGDSSIKCNVKAAATVSSLIEVSSQLHHIYSTTGRVTSAGRTIALMSMHVDAHSNALPYIEH